MNVAHIHTQITQIHKYISLWSQNIKYRLHFKKPLYRVPRNCLLITSDNQFASEGTGSHAACSPNAKKTAFQRSSRASTSMQPKEVTALLTEHFNKDLESRFKSLGNNISCSENLLQAFESHRIKGRKAPWASRLRPSWHLISTGI